MKLLLSFPQGLEDMVREELSEKASLFEAAEPLGASGKLVINIPAVNSKRVFPLRSVDSVTEYVGSLRVEKDKKALVKMYDEATRIDFPEGFRKASSFRVTCNRRGVHEYTSIDVERAIGQALVDKYGVKVDLKGFEANVLVEIVEDACFISLVKEDYSWDEYLVFTHPAPSNLQ